MQTCTIKWLDLRLPPIRFFVSLAILAFIPRLHAEPVPQAVEAYASLPFVTRPSLSPDGSKVAMILNSNGQTFVTTDELGKKQKMKQVVSTDNKTFKINWVSWANNYNIRRPMDNLLMLTRQCQNIQISRKNCPPLSIRGSFFIKSSRSHKNS